MHIRKRTRRANPRDSKRSGFNYHSSRWRAKRKVILARDGYKCQTCKRDGRITQGNTVDHIKPINQGGDPYEDDNLETICVKCHARKSAKERRNIKL